MAQIPQPFVCDVCGVLKGEQNHWFKVFIHPQSRDRVQICRWEILDFSTGLQDDCSIRHCCGEEHAVRKAAELLGKLKSA